MNNLAIYGAGGLGREIACLINLINEKEKKWNLIGFFDDGKKIGDRNEYGSVLGGISEVNNWSSELNIVFGIGNPSILSKLSASITNSQINFPNIIAPNTIFLDKNNIIIGRGNVICSSSIISCNIQIGDFNIFNGQVTIGHDTTIGNCNAFMPAVKISGEVKIGINNFFGVNSVVLQGIIIGNNTVIGANSLILRKTKDGNTYVGNPAVIVHH